LFVIVGASYDNIPTIDKASNRKLRYVIY